MGAKAGFIPGTLLDGKYEILGILGAGGMGEVYKARHIHLGAFRCIKVMKPSLMADEVYRQRFLREARLATQIHHPNLAVVHDFSLMPDGASYMVTEFIDGTTVRQWEAANGRFPLALAIEVALQVLGGLDHIHRRGLLHRDVSADNVMLAFDADDNLVVKIIDLGVAKDVTTANSADTTQAGVFVGNPKYMSPEQLGELDEGEMLDGRADLYSMGVVLYEMLTGVPPFAARTPNGYIVKHLTEAPPSFRTVNPTLDLPHGLEPVVLRALQKKRTQRWGSARELADALTPFAAPTRRAIARTDVPKTIAAEPTEDMLANEAWSAALAADTYTAFREFRTKFPAHHVEEAERAIAERLAFDHAAAIDTEEAWEEYLENWRDDRHATAAIERLDSARVREETAYCVALEAKSPAAWRAYLDEFPDGKRSGNAENHLRETMAYEEARGVDTVASWGLFLLNHPEGLFEAFARARVEWLEGAEQRRAIARRAIVEGDFDHAWEIGTVAAWDDYIGKYPDAPRIEDARANRQESQEYDLAAQMNTKVMWRAFLKAWPQGRHRLDAEVRLRSLG
ncbi:MAG TPA: serine/threonine-protein kinase [Thermoanaerobaculia bacterium]